MADLNVSDLFKKEKNPIKKFANSLADKLQAKAEEKLTGALSDALAKVGLGQGSGKNIVSQLGDAIVADLAAEFFGALGKDINRATKEEIQQNRGLIDADADDPGTLETETQGDASNVLRFPSTLNDYHMRLEIKKYKRPTLKIILQAYKAQGFSQEFLDRIKKRHQKRLEFSKKVPGIIDGIFNKEPVKKVKKVKKKPEPEVDLEIEEEEQEIEEDVIPPEDGEMDVEVEINEEEQEEEYISDVEE